MLFQRFESGFQLRFESGEPLLDGMLRFLDAQGIRYAAMTGLGAVRAARVSYWNAETQEYEGHDLDEQLEVVSLIGNVTEKGDGPFLHIHVTLGRRDLSIVGGHLNDLVVHPNLEISVRPEPAAVRRTLDDSCGLWVMDLPERT